MLALAVAGANTSHAMSEFASLTLTPLWPTNSTPGNVVSYGVTLERLGSGMLSVDFSSSGLPEGTTVSFTQDPARYTGNNPRFMYFVMTVTATKPTPTDSFTFVVTGTSRRESISVTNTIQNLFKGNSTAPVLLSLDLRPSGDVELRGLGTTGESYQIEATNDLNNPTWTSVGLSTAEGNGRFTFIHAAAQSPGIPMRFYRAVKPGPSNP